MICSHYEAIKGDNSVYAKQTFSVKDKNWNIFSLFDFIEFLSWPQVMKKCSKLNIIKTNLYCLNLC